MSYLRLGSENEQLRTLRSGLGGPTGAHRGASPLLRVPCSAGSSLGSCGQPVGTRGWAAQSSVEVNASASPAYTKKLC